MKIGFDIHGVIDRLPIIFIEFANMLIANNHEVHIITGVSEERAIRELTKLNFPYSHLFSITTYYKQYGTPIRYNEKGPWLNTTLWDKAKAEYCKRTAIDLHFDDSDVYHRFFVTPYAKLIFNNVNQ